MKAIILCAALLTPSLAFANGTCTTYRYGDGIDVEVTCTDDEHPDRQRVYSHHYYGAQHEWQLDGWHDEPRQ